MQGNTMTKSEQLAAVAASVKAHLNDSACGPLAAALELQPIIEHWAEFKSAADNVDPSRWLTSVLGPCAGGKTKSWGRYFVQRAEAVTLLGRESARKIHHEMAIWIVGKLGHGKITDLEWARVKKALYADTHGRGRPLTPTEGKRLVAATLGWQKAPRSHVCRRCLELEAKCREAGIEV